MKLIHTPGLAALLLSGCLLAGCGEAQSGIGSGPGTTPTPAVAFTDPTNHFSAAFAGKPVEDKTSQVVAGATLNETIWSDAVSVDMHEVIIYATYPSTFDFSAPNAALDGAVAGAVSSSKGVLISKTPGFYQGFPSVDAIIQLKNGYGEMRVVLHGQTIFIVLVDSPHNPPELFKSFAASLNILG